MTALTGPELAWLWIKNGGNPKYADTFAGIGLSQSGGSATAVYNTAYPNDPGYSAPLSYANPEYSIGFWQINLLAHPNYTAAQLADPNNQAKAVIAISNNGADLTPWLDAVNPAHSDPVAQAAANNGGVATLAQINAALATEGKSYGGGAVIPQSIKNQINQAYPSAASSSEGGGNCGGSFQINRPGGCCSSVYAINFGGVAGVGKFSLFSECQARGFLGALMMVGGGVIAIAGLATLLASAGLRRGTVSSAAGTVPGVGAVADAASRSAQNRSAGRSASQASAARLAEAERLSELRMTEREHAASTRRYGAGRGISQNLNDDEPF